MCFFNGKVRTYEIGACKLLQSSLLDRFTTHTVGLFQALHYCDLDTHMFYNDVRVCARVYVRACVRQCFVVCAFTQGTANHDGRKGTLLE